MEFDLSHVSLCRGNPSMDVEHSGKVPITRNGWHLDCAGIELWAGERGQWASIAAQQRFNCVAAGSTNAGFPALHGKTDPKSADNWPKYVPVRTFGFINISNLCFQRDGQLHSNNPMGGKQEIPQTRSRIGRAGVGTQGQFSRQFDRLNSEECTHPTEWRKRSVPTSSKTNGAGSGNPTKLSVADGMSTG